MYGLFTLHSFFDETRGLLRSTIVCSFHETILPTNETRRYLLFFSSLVSPPSPPYFCINSYLVSLCTPVIEKSILKIERRNKLSIKYVLTLSGLYQYLQTKKWKTEKSKSSL